MPVDIWMCIYNTDCWKKQKPENLEDLRSIKDQGVKMQHP